MKVSSRLLIPLICAVLCVGAVELFAAEGEGIRHRFLVVDDAGDWLSYIDQHDPTNNWQVKRGGGHGYDLQLVGNDRVAAVNGSGYREFRLSDGKMVKDAKRVASDVTSLERLSDGRTVLGCATSVVVLAADDTVAQTLAIPGARCIRHVRTTPRGTLLLADENRLLECRMDGSIVQTIPLSGRHFKAVELVENEYLVSSFHQLRRVTQAGQVLATTESKKLEGNIGSFTGFQCLTNGNTVVTIWASHFGGTGPMLYELDPAGKIVWRYDMTNASVVETIVLDGLDTSRLHAQQRDGVVRPVLDASKVENGTPQMNQHKDQP